MTSPTSWHRSGISQILLIALRYTLHPPKSGEGTDVKGLRPTPPAMRIFVLGARAESSLPRDAWVELAHLFPDSRIHLIFIGPESMANRDSEFPLPERTAQNPFGMVIEDRVWTNMKISTIVDYYHTVHKTEYFAPYDPYFDCFLLFHPGLGHPASSHEWAETLPMLLETKIPIICTGYSQADMQRDSEWVDKTAKGEYDLLLEPGENRFRSLRWDLNDMDPGDVSCGNWGVWAFRGKRYVLYCQFSSINDQANHEAQIRGNEEGLSTMCAHVVSGEGSYSPFSVLYPVRRKYRLYRTTQFTPNVMSRKCSTSAPFPLEITCEVSVFDVTFEDPESPGHGSGRSKAHAPGGTPCNEPPARIPPHHPMSAAPPTHRTSHPRHPAKRAHNAISPRPIRGMAT